VFEVRQLIDDKARWRPRRPCTICGKWASIDELLRNAPPPSPTVAKNALTEMIDLRAELKAIGERAAGRHDVMIGRFDQADAAADRRTKEILSKVEAAYDGMIRTIVDEAKEGRGCSASNRWSPASGIGRSGSARSTTSPVVRAFAAAVAGAERQGR